MLRFGSVAEKVGGDADSIKGERGWNAPGPSGPWCGFPTDDDLKAIFAYLQTIPPITNHVPDYQESPTASKAASTRK